MKVSIIIPTKNEEKNIGNCLESLAEQIFQDFEVIVCDGGSSDMTEQIVEKHALAKEKSKLTFHILKPKLGYQRRFGAEQAKGKYLCFIDADMILTPKVLESCFNKLEASSQQLGAVIIPEISFGIGFWAKVKAFEKKMYIGDDRIEAARFFLKEAYEKSGGWGEKLAAGEDWDLTRRVKEAGYTVARTKELIRHNEGKIDLWRTLKRKFYYAQKSQGYVEQNVKGLKDYLLFTFRPAYFRHWREFLKHPVLGVSFIFMKSSELLAGFLGIISKKIIKVNYERTK